MIFPYETDSMLLQMQGALSYCPRTGNFSWKIKSGRKSAGSLAGTIDNGGYVGIRFERRMFKAHRIAWAMHFGKWPIGILDHINRNRCDNRICNLRIASTSQNNINKGPIRTNISGTSGVCFFKRVNLWTAYIGYNNQRIYLGYFKQKNAAVEARRLAEKQLFGEFSYDASADFSASLNVGYEAIRQRVADGGEPWQTK